MKKSVGKKEASCMIESDLGDRLIPFKNKH